MIIQVQLLRHQYFPSNFAFISLLDTPPVPCYTIIKSNIEGVHGAVIDYLKYQHDEFHLVPILDENGNSMANMEIMAEGIAPMKTKFETNKEKIRNAMLGSKSGF